jgi:hypothetical protein
MWKKDNSSEFAVLSSEWPTRIGFDEGSVGWRQADALDEGTVAWIGVEEVVSRITLDVK